MIKQLLFACGMLVVCGSECISQSTEALIRQSYTSSVANSVSAQRSQPGSAWFQAEDSTMDKGSQMRKPYEIHVGPYISFIGGGIGIQIPNGRKTDVVFRAVPEFGVTAYAPFNRTGKLGFALSIGIDGYQYLNKPESGSVQAGVSTNDVAIVEKYTYLNIFPHLNLGGFVLGVGIESPLSGSTELKNGTEVSVLRDTSASAMSMRNPGRTNSTPLGNNGSGLGIFKVGTSFGEPSPKYEDFLSSLIALKVGVDMPAMEEAWGHLNVRAIASYPLGRLYSDARNYLLSDEFKNNAWIHNADFNPSTVSLNLGVSLYFNIAVKK